MAAVLIFCVILCIFCVLLLSAYVLLFAVLGWAESGEADRPAAAGLGAGKTRFIVFVPAHDEGEYLRPTARSLKGLDYPADQVHVVFIADNCSDNTAQVAAAEGCEVWERSDPTLLGKGHALAWAFRRPETMSYDAVVVIDADTVASPNLLSALDREIGRGYDALQVRYNFEFPADAPPWLRLISRAAKLAVDAYVTRPRSRFRLYQGLQGTGFCLSTKLLRQVPWRADSICEDLEYGLDLARQGEAVHFIEDASVSAVMTGQVKHASGQRQRWAGGTYALIANRLPGLFVQGFRRRDWRSLEACVFLLTLSRIPLFLLTVVSALLVLVAWHHVPFVWVVLFGVAVLMQGLYVLAILSTNRREAGMGRMIGGVFLYVGWISFQHLGALLHLRHARWNRTERG
jgi:1,2-diacylglycerol 3-beta-glucosyltransferase